MERIEVLNKLDGTTSLAIGYIINGEVHILRPSSSRYGLTINNNLVGQYCCQDGCCDAGLTPSVKSLVYKAAEKGATAVVLRTGQRHYRVPNIYGLPVRDIENYYGKTLPDGAQVINLRAYFNRRAR